MKLKLMIVSSVFSLSGLLGIVVRASRNPEVVGYWENWVDVKWWDNDIPGNCLMGCAKPSAFMSKIKDYSSVNYGFTFLTENPTPDQINCSDTSLCPVWDGKAIYMAKDGKPGSHVVQDSTDVNSITPGLISVGEVCRLARMGPAGPRRCNICFGGWSDFARIATKENARKIGKLVAKMVLLSFADGVDLDFEHLSEYSRVFDDEFGPYQEMVATIRSELDKINDAMWSKTAHTRIVNLNKTYNNMPAWQKKKAFYYPTNMHYLQQVADNGPPTFEITWTTRFNAFLDPKDPFNIYDPDSPHPNVPFLTDNEGTKIWPVNGDHYGAVNIMAYDAGSDAGALKINFEQVLENFNALGKVDMTKVNIGFEPGNQYAGGKWEGIDRDVKVTKYQKEKGYGGAMVWAINPNSRVSPESAHWAPLVAKEVYSIVNPVWPYGKAPVYDKCDPRTGWWSNTTSKSVF